MSLLAVSGDLIYGTGQASDDLLVDKRLLAAAASACTWYHQEQLDNIAVAEHSLAFLLDDD